jgi:7-cyano-7-deazaguanine synthase in queuosine biosynthesis
MKSVMLFSGGFDSRLQAMIIKPDVLLYVDMRSVYSDIEIEHLDQLPALMKKKLIITKPLDMSQFENPVNNYVPFRNIYLALTALQYGQRIIFGFNEGDTAPDKTTEFLHNSAKYLEAFTGKHYRPVDWTGGKISIEAPYRTFTKADMVRTHLIRYHTSKSVIAGIRSCYDKDSKKGCGNCTPCIAKAVALIINKISTENVFDRDVTVEILNEYRKYAKYFRGTTRTYEQYVQAVNMIKGIK